jgi:hypothetical protein
MDATEITTATPAAIDAEILRLGNEVADLYGRRNALSHQHGRAREAARTGGYYSGKPLTELATLIERLEDQIVTLDGEIAPLNAEYSRRGGWTRYYLADSHDGHVHSSTECSTCHHGHYCTGFYWLTSESDRTAQDVVAEAKDQACTTCFPWAPVTGQRGRYRTPTQIEAEQRAAEKAAKAAARKAAEITAPDGQPLREAYVSTTGELRFSGQIKTAVAAKRAALAAAFDLKWYGTTHPDALAWEATVERCVAALAARDGVPVDQVAAEIETKAIAKYKRETR